MKLFKDLTHIEKQQWALNNLKLIPQTKEEKEYIDKMKHMLLYGVIILEN